MPELFLALSVSLSRHKKENEQDADFLSANEVENYFGFPQTEEVPACVQAGCTYSASSLNHNM